MAVLAGEPHRSRWRPVHLSERWGGGRPTERQRGPHRETFSNIICPGRGASNGVVGRETVRVVARLEGLRGGMCSLKRQQGLHWLLSSPVWRRRIYRSGGASHTCPESSQTLRAVWGGASSGAVGRATLIERHRGPQRVLRHY